MARKKPATKAERAHLDRIAGLGCCLCGGLAEVHHITTGIGMGQRASHFDTIPLCAAHHRTGGHGVAIHAGKRTWEARHGPEIEWLEHVRSRL